MDIGTIRLQVDEHFLDAAVVSAVGNPIVVKQDTVEFNASSFRVGANAMLKDLPPTANVPKRLRGTWCSSQFVKCKVFDTLL